MSKKKGTVTSPFGTGKHESHDSSLFYSRQLLVVEEDLKGEAVQTSVDDLLVCGSSETMTDLVDNSVGLAVTSPPYHVGKEYDSDLSFSDHLALMERVFQETYRVLEPGGRLVVNCAGLGRKPYVSMQTYMNTMLLDLKYLPRGEVVWVKGKGASGSCAWGSYMKASNPTFRDVHEWFLVFSKERYSRGRTGISTITRDDFLESTLSVWYVAPESAKRVGHPAPFPVEIPRRFIELHSYADDLILDPFIGAGTTAVAAVRTGRRFVGYDTDQSYIDRARERVGVERGLRGSHSAA